MERGQVLSLIGSSGSGKTTLLRCLNFLETPDKGVIRVNDELLFDDAYDFIYLYSVLFFNMFFFKYCHLSLPPHLIKIFQLLLKLSKKDCQNTIEEQIIKSCKEHRPDRT